MAGRRCDVLIAGRTIVELETGIGIGIDLGERGFLRNVSQGDAAIGVPDRFANHQLVGAGLADEAALLFSRANSRVIGKEGLAPTE
jgi:hypothetical protein